MSGKLKNGIHAYFLRDRGDGTKVLSCVTYDGAHFSSAIDCTLSGDVGTLIAAPFALWTGDVPYSGLSNLVHVFIPTGDNAVCWLISEDGFYFEVGNLRIDHIATDRRVAALITGTQISFYYSRGSVQSLYHARAVSGWTCESTEPITLNNSLIEMNWTPAVATRDGTVNLVYNRLVGDEIRLVYLQDPAHPGAGNGIWADGSPWKALAWHAPSLCRLGRLLYLVFQGPQGQSPDDLQIYYLTVDDIGHWSKTEGIPDSFTVDQPGICAWGDRLYCFFQSSEARCLYAQVFVDGRWQDQATIVPDVAGVISGISAIAISGQN